MLNKHRLNTNSDGFAALIVALIMVIILSLVTVGFAELMRHEQNQSTNRQLSNQAYYAAESGVNDAIRAINDGFASQKTNCGPETGSVPPPGINSTAQGWKDLTDNNVDTTSATSPGAEQWTCLLIDAAPNSLEYNPVDTVTPTVVTAVPVSSDRSTPASIKKLTIYWKDAGNTSTPVFNNSPAISGANPSWPTAPNWPYIGMVRVGITPLIAPLTRASLTASTVTAFLYPSTSTSNNFLTDSYANAFGGPSQMVAAQSQQGSILNGGCVPNPTSTPFYCSATIYFDDGHGAGLPAGTPVMFNLRSIYNKTHIYITADDGNTYFKDAQVLVDSTGRAQNVLKRLLVRVPAQNHYDYPGFAVDGTSGVCKTLTVMPGGGSSSCP